MQTPLHVHHLPGIPVDLPQLINCPLHYSKGVEQDWNRKHIDGCHLVCPVSSEDQIFRSRFLYLPRRASFTLGASCTRCCSIPRYLKFSSASRCLKMLLSASCTSSGNSRDRFLFKWNTAHFSVPSSMPTSRVYSWTTLRDCLRSFSPEAHNFRSSR